MQVEVTLVIHANVQKLNDQADEVLEVEIRGQCKVDPLVAQPYQAGDVYCHTEAHESYSSVQWELEGREFDRAVLAAALAAALCHLQADFHHVFGSRPSTHCNPYELNEKENCVV